MQGIGGMMNIGLDFGTTYTFISFIKSGGILSEFYPSEDGNATLPSIVVKKVNGNFETGTSARKSIGSHGACVYTGFKMMLGVRDEIFLKSRGYDDKYTPERITGIYLEKILNLYFERTHERKVEKLVVCVPQIWYSTQERLECGTTLKRILEKNERVDNVRIISEPSAACAYLVVNYRKSVGSNFLGKILVVDYGGGTLDIALCDVAQNGERSQVSVLKTTGAGENAEGVIGKAGLAFLEGVVELALKDAHPEKSRNDFKKCVDDFEGWLFEKTSDIKNRFMSSMFVNFEEIEEEFCTLNYISNEYPISYGMLAKVYNKLIKPVLEENINEMIEYMRSNNINYSASAGDTFKIAMVGGFCGFYLTQLQIRVAFHSSGTDDQRFKDLPADRGECEKAVSFGATLISNNIIEFKQYAPYSLGIANMEGQKFYAVRKGDEINYNCPILIGNGILFSASRIPRIVFNFFDDENRVQIREPLEKYRRSLVFDPNKMMKLAFSFDESMVITLHQYIDDNEQKVRLDSLPELLGGGLLDV
ncbi:MAG: Hsp70 family protein [Clostridiales bacterium]|nr:Hsp70 family protein [Clostridiales bacterium]